MGRLLLQVDERVIRHLVSKHSVRAPQPSTKVVSKWATTILDREYAAKLGVRPPSTCPSCSPSRPCLVAAQSAAPT